MAGEQHRHSFWTTLPGILTGVAAVVTALTGLMIGLSQSGWLGSSAERSEGAGATTAHAERTSSRPTDAARPPAGPSSAPSTLARDAPADAAKKEATVVITAQDGSVATVYADSLQHRQHGRALFLLSGQTIPFDRIKTIDVTRIESDQARVNVTLVNGAVHSGSISAGLSPFAFTGVNDLGSFEIRVDKLARIAFER